MSVSDDDNFPDEIGKFIGGAFKHILLEAIKTQKVQTEKETIDSLKKQNKELLEEIKQLKELLQRERLDKLVLDLD